VGQNIKEMNQDIFIHIGMPKAASTTLQRNFFERQTAIKYVCFTPDSPQTNSAELLTSILYSEDEDLDLDVIRAGLQEFSGSQSPVVISNENILMPGASLGIYNTMYRTQVAHRLSALFPKGKILLVVRNPIAFLQSMYVQILFNYRLSKNRKYGSFQNFIDEEIEKELQGMPSILKVADYKSILQLYSSLFRDIKVVILEEVRSDFAGFLRDDLSSWLGLDGGEALRNYTQRESNLRHSKAEIIGKKSIHWGLSALAALGNPHKVLPESTRVGVMKSIRKGISFFDFWTVKTDFTPAQLEFVYQYYAPRNQWLANYVNKDLSQWGYPV
jgi:hypothetical protein